MPRRAENIASTGAPRTMCVRYIDGEDGQWRRCRALASIVDEMVKRQCGDFRMNVAGAEGEVTPVDFNSISLTAPKDVRSLDRRTLSAVEIVRSDGSVEFGFKQSWRETIVHGRNAILEPYFMREGVWSHADGCVKECPDGVTSARGLPAWAVKGIPFYNERMRDEAVGAAKGRSVPYTPYALAMHQVMHSSMISRHATYGRIPNSSGDSGLCAYVESPTGAMHMSDMPWRADSVQVVPSSTSSYVHSTYGGHAYTCTYHVPSGQTYTCTYHTPTCSSEYVGGSTVFVYRYVKSMYSDATSMRMVHRLYPISNILNVEKVYRPYSEPVEIWNNLDQTIAGNV